MNENEPDRDAELEGDDGEEQHHGEFHIEDLPPKERAIIEKQVKQIEREAAENPQVGH